MHGADAETSVSLGKMVETKSRAKRVKIVMKHKCSQNFWCKFYIELEETERQQIASFCRVRLTSCQQLNGWRCLHANAVQH